MLFGVSRPSQSRIRATPDRRCVDPVHGLGRLAAAGRKVGEGGSRTRPEAKACGRCDFWRVPDKGRAIDPNSG